MERADLGACQGVGVGVSGEAEGGVINGAAWGTGPAGRAWWIDHASALGALHTPSARNTFMLIIALLDRRTRLCVPTAGHIAVAQQLGKPET